MASDHSQSQGACSSQSLHPPTPAQQQQPVCQKVVNWAFPMVASSWALKQQQTQSPQQQPQHMQQQRQRARVLKRLNHRVLHLIEDDPKSVVVAMRGGLGGAEPPSFWRVTGDRTVRWQGMSGGWAAGPLADAVAVMLRAQAAPKLAGSIMPPAGCLVSPSGRRPIPAWVSKEHRHLLTTYLDLNATGENLIFLYSKTPFIVNPRKDFLGDITPTLHDGRPTGRTPFFVWRKVELQTWQEQQQPVQRADVLPRSVGAEEQQQQQEQQEPACIIPTGCVAVDAEHFAVPWVVWDWTGEEMGWAVYAWRTFAVGEVVGVYGGHAIASVQGMQAKINKLQHDDRFDAIVKIGRYFIDGKQAPPTGYQGQDVLLHDPAKYPWPGIHAALINSSDSPSCDRINLQLTDPLGAMQATRDITVTYDPFSVSIHDAEQRAAVNAAAQLLWWYGNDYFDIKKQRVA